MNENNLNLRISYEWSVSPSIGESFELHRMRHSGNHHVVVCNMLYC
jgi:hypothetical protein